MPPMQITRTNPSGIVCLHLEGRFDEFATSGAEAEFAEVVKEGALRVLLDLSGVEYVTSSGLRTILPRSCAMCV